MDFRSIKKYSLLNLAGLILLFLNPSEGIARNGSPDTYLDQQNMNASVNWQSVTTVEDMWEAYPEKVRFLIASLDLQHKGLERARKAFNKGDTVEGCKALLQYYKNANTAEWLRTKSWEFENPTIKKHAKQILNDKLTFGEVTGKVPKTSNGGWKWTYTGPEDDPEFGYSLNGHKYFTLFLKGWDETGNEAYVDKFDQVIRDWIIHNPLPEKPDPIYEVHSTTTEELDWRDIGEVVWRDLEVGRRFAIAWPQTFFGFQQSDAFTPAGRLLMLASIPVQAKYVKKYHKHGHNWTTIEMDGLGLIGLTFPEYKKAEEWVNYALEVMEKEINGQVYPDGTQTELSTKTQWVSLGRFESLVENFRSAGRTVPESYLKRLEDMYNYMAYAMRPDGHQPLNNDSDREDLGPRVLKAAKEYNRPDWEYIATNGQKGQKPDGLTSTVFPWAGIHIMRNGWDKMSHWAFFDSGPFGTGHQHSDMLNLAIHAYGRDLLVDGGRFTHKNYFSFDPSMWRGYFRSSFSHNVVLVDGKGQNNGPLTTDEPLKEGGDYVNNPQYHYARGTFKSGFNEVDGKVEHTRAVFYVRGKYWVVLDHIATDRPRKLETLWHYNPECNVKVKNKEVVSDDRGKGNLRIVPVGDISWNIDIVKGKTEPYKQGWYSETYGKKEPNPTAVYSADVEGDATFAWVLVPAKGKVPEVQAELLDKEMGKVKVKIEGEEPVFVTVPLKRGNPALE